ncbi:MAG TPA: hypothetical protein VHR86_01115, partial [Armatimonadota bacterium]|nr:hypothetical protein [Armatimonadota bacterium]
KHIESALTREGAEARLSDERLRTLFSRADGQFRVVGWIGSKKPADTTAPVAETQEEKSE